MRTMIALTLAVGLVLVASLSALPIAIGGPYGPNADQTLLALYLVPQAVPLALPVALCVGVAYALRGRRADPRALWRVAAFAGLCVLVVLVFFEWVIPAANQAFREHIRAGQVVPPRGINEQSLTTLAGRSDAEAQLGLHVRIAMTLGIAALAAYAVGVARFATRRLTAAALVIAGPVGWIGGFLASRVTGPDPWPVLAVWLPSLCVAAAAIVLLRLARTSRAGTASAA